MKRIAVAAALLAALVLLGTDLGAMADEFAGEARSISVLSVSGEDVFVSRGTGKEVKAAAGMPLGQGSSARTGAAAGMYLKADEDRTVKMAGNTRVEIEKASEKKLGIAVKSGEIFFDVEKKLAEDEELEFRTARTSLSIRGTSGFLETEADGRVRLYLLEGSVEWKAGETAIRVDAGQGGIYTPARGMQQEELEKVEAFTWEDLNAFQLDTLLNDAHIPAMESVGLEREEIPAARETAGELLSLEKEKEEETKRQEESFSWSCRPEQGGTGGIIGGKEPVAEGDRKDEDVILEEPTEEEPTEEEPTEEEPTEESLPELIESPYGYLRTSVDGIETFFAYQEDWSAEAIREGEFFQILHDASSGRTGEFFYFWLVEWDGSIYAFTVQECRAYDLPIITRQPM